MWLRIFNLNLFFLLFGGLLGACLGSFFGVISNRLAKDGVIVLNDRSHCQNCCKNILPQDLIPILSYIFLRGKCRFCGAKIHVKHLIFEIVGFGLGMGTFAFFNTNIYFVIILFTGVFTLYLNALTDIEEGNIYDVFALFPGVIGLMVRLVWDIFSVNDVHSYKYNCFAPYINDFFAKEIPETFQFFKHILNSQTLDGIIGVLLGYVLFAGMIVFSKIILKKEGMGWGDCTLAMGMGALLGSKLLLVGLYIGFIFGGIAITPLIFLGILKRTDTIPFGPALAVGFLISLFFGPYIFNYFNLPLPWLFCLMRTWPLTNNNNPTIKNLLGNDKKLIRER